MYLVRSLFILNGYKTRLLFALVVYLLHQRLACPGYLDSLEAGRVWVYLEPYVLRINKAVQDFESAARGFDVRDVEPLNELLSFAVRQVEVVV